MSKIKLSDYVAKRLKEYGIEHFFMVSGGGAMHLNDSLGRYLKYICNHHEQASAFAAEGFARVNQHMAVVNVTTGPGGLNCLNPLFGQYTDSVPVLYISGQVKRATMLDNCKTKPRQLGDQEVDIIQTVKHLTKYAVCVKNPCEIRYHLERAIYEATTGRFGPCWLDIPIDVQSALVDEDSLEGFKIHSDAVYNYNIDEVIKKLSNAKKPLIVAGHGIRLSNQIDNFKKLINKLKIPIVTTFNGFDVLDDKNPFYVGRIGTIGQRAGNFSLQNADLILFLGTRNNIRQVSYNWENFAKNAYKIVVDIDEKELNKPLVKPNLAIKADLAQFIPNLLSKSLNLDKNNWLKFCQNLKQKYSFENHLEFIRQDKINPYDFTYTLSKCMKENDVLVMANGSCCVCSFQNAVVKENQRFILNSGSASMGFALPAAIGAYCDANYEASKRNVICLEGDGSIMMNLQELETIKYNKIPLKIFIINNNGYSSIRQSQKNFFEGRMSGSGVDSGVCVPNFCAVAAAFEIKSVKLDDLSKAKDVINEVLSCNEPVVCEVIAQEDYSFTPKLSSKKLEDGTVVSLSLEDMYPFLPKEEMKENVYRI